MTLANDVLAGDRRAAARLLRAIDDELPAAEAALRDLFPRTGRAHVVGVTGTPGAGKSTLCDRLIARWRAQGRTVGVLAVDPTSPFTGGAILGDRIRMQEHALDKGVFIRSLATRGNLGGLSRATFDSAKVFDAMGFDVVLVETVGVGQDEVEIAQLAHTTLVVTVPGLGDDVQAIKAGILEIADVFVVNKADREGADRTVRDLRGLLELRRSHPVPGEPEPWEPPIVSCVAVRDEGLAELAAAIDRHWRQLDASGEKLRREAARARTELLSRLQARLMGRALSALEARTAPLDELSLRVARRETDPYALADEALRALGIGGPA
jgi:LAO/AO transport system kinase